MSSPSLRLCVIRYDNIRGALDAEACVLCHDRMSAPRRDPDICDDCSDDITKSSSSISEVKLLKLKTHAIFAFYTSFRKQTLFSRFISSHQIIKDVSTTEPPIRDITIEMGIPGETTTLPEIPNLDKKTQRLYDLVLLSAMDCQFAVMHLEDVLRVEFVDNPESPVAKIEEIYFKPKHPSVSGHWVHRATLESGEQFALAFTDRQIGRIRLVTPWKEYEKDCIEVIDTSGELGHCNKMYWDSSPKEDLRVLVLAENPLRDVLPPGYTDQEYVKMVDRWDLIREWHHKVIEEGWVLEFWDQLWWNFPEIHQRSYDEIAEFVEFCSQSYD